MRKIQTYTGPVGLVSHTIACCNESLGFPTKTIHSANFGHVYFEYRTKEMLATLWTVPAENEFHYKISIDFCSEKPSAGHTIDVLDEKIKSGISDPSLFDLVLLLGGASEQTTENDKSTEEDAL